MRQDKLNRLRQLANFLLELSPKKFDLNNWKSLCNKDKNKCSTTACAIGWDCDLHPRSKLHLAKDEWVSWDNQTKVDFYPEYKDKTYEDAIASFYGMTLKEADYLFMPHSYGDGHKGPKSVGRRILKFVEKKEKERRSYA